MASTAETVKASASLNQTNETINLDENDNARPSKKSKETSDVWDYFRKTKIGEDGIQRVECIACKTEYRSGGKKYGTSTLKRHLEKCKKVELDSTKCQEKMSLVKESLYKLFKLYDDNSSYSQSDSSPSITLYTRTQSVGMKGSGKRMFDEFKEYDSQTVLSAGKSQLDLYLEEPKLEFAHYEDLDVLDYWKNHKYRYPTLALMACDVLAIPITTVASESAFSIGGRVLTKYRSSTLPEKVQALICTRNWLHGYVDDNDGKTINNTTLPDEETNVFEILDEEENEDATKE